MKIQSVHLQSMFQREETVLLSFMKMKSQQAPSNIPFVDLDDALVASDNESLAESNNPDEQSWTLMTKERDFGTQMWSCSRTKNSPVSLDPSWFQYELQDSPLTTSRANKTIVYVLRLVVLCWIPCPLHLLLLKTFLQVLCSTHKLPSVANTLALSLKSPWLLSILLS